MGLHETESTQGKWSLLHSLIDITVGSLESGGHLQQLTVGARRGGILSLEQPSVEKDSFGEATSLLQRIHHDPCFY